MKEAIIPTYTFTAATKQLDFTSFVGFDIRKLTAVINVTANQIIYAVGQPSVGLASISGSILTLVYNTTAMNNSDNLMILYDQVEPEQHVVDTGSDLYVPGTTRGVLSNAAVTDPDDPDTLIVGRFTGLKTDTAGNLLVHVTSAPVSAPSASATTDYVSANKVYSLGLNLNQASSGVDNPLILIRNPIGSGKTLYLYRIQAAATATNTASNFLLYANPTVTVNGTAQTPQNNNVGNGAPASVMLVNSLSTISSLGTYRLATYNYGQNNNSINSLEDFSIFLQPGNSLILTGNPSANNRQAAITLTWAEV